VRRKVGIIDYGAGNIKSVYNCFSYLGAECQTVSDASELHLMDYLILPGVGSFRKAVEELRGKKIDLRLKEMALKGVPLLGICLGMQLMASRSSEDGESLGLNLIPGDVDRFSIISQEKGLKIPNVGFSTVSTTAGSHIFKSLGYKCDFYFTHSYHMRCTIKNHIAGTAWHGETYVAAIENGRVIGTQFHPEKSQANGLLVLENFLNIL